MEVTHNHNAKSQLAKLLATENITVQHSPSAKTAWFDVKNRVLMLPVWREMSNDLYDLLVVHEVGHALDTPNDGLMEAIEAIAKRITGKVSPRAMSAVKGFLNVIEDARIDKRQKRRFPGARRNYVIGYRELVERDFFGTLTRDVNSMSFIDRLNIYCKGGSMLGIKFTAEEKQWVAKVEAAETFDEVLSLTEQIYAWSKDKLEQEQEEASNERQKSGNFGDDDSDEFEDSDSDDYEDSDDMDGSGSMSFDDDAEDEEDSDDSEESDDKSGDEKSDDPISGGSVHKSADKDEEEILPESETEKAWQQNVQTLIQSSEFEYVHARLPKLVDYNRTVVDYKQVLADQRAVVATYSKDWQTTARNGLLKFKSDENASISFMVKEFEMRKAADEYTRTSISKTGVIDTNKLHSYKYNDDLFRRITTVASGKNHGFVMFVDWSGSMDRHLQKTVRQLLSLVMFCRRVQVPFEVYIFRSVNYSDKIHSCSFTQNKNELEMGNLYIRNVLSSRMTAQEMNDAMFHMYLAGHGNVLSCDNLGSTPLNPCIVAASEIVNRFKARSKVQVVNTIFLTDGESDPISCVHGSGYSWKSTKYIIQDEITKKNYDVPMVKNSRYSYSSLANNVMTPILFKMLRDRTGCNLIGFHITVDGFEREYRRHNTTCYGEHYNTAKSDWKNNGFFSVSNAGYDEYYILNPNMFNIASGNLKVGADISKRKLVSEFIKFSEKKTVSRVLLSKVVKRIAA